MGQMLSPGVQVNEIDLSIVVPQLGNATACFAGVFTKGPSDKFLLITNGEELINYYGGPTNDNYNDWFQAYNFLQYANKLLVSRAVDSNGTYTDAVKNNEVLIVNEPGKVEIKNVPTEIFVGSMIKFTKTADMTGEYKVNAIEAPVTAVAQVSTVSVTGSVSEGTTVSIAINYNGNVVSSDFTGETGGNTAAEAATGLAADISADTNGVTATATGTLITITAIVAGVETIFSGTNDALLTTPEVVTANVEGESYELVLSDYRGATDLDFSSIAVTGQNIYVRDSAINAIVEAPIGATYTKNSTGVITAIATEAAALKSGDELKPEAMFIPNDDVYELGETSIPVGQTTKLKFFAKSSGDMQNYTEIAIARQKDFDFGSALVFKGLPLNDFFETKPLEANSEIAIVIRQFGKVVGAYIVSLIPGSKDYRNKSNYVEDIINKYDLLFYVKDNTNVSTMPQSRLYSTVEPTVVVDPDTGVSSIKDMPTLANGPLKTSNGTNGVVGVDDIINALGNVTDNTIFGNKEELDIDIVIANELARVECGKLAAERADCIAFIGAKFGDVVGLQAAVIVENLVKDVMHGDLNNAGTANSFCAFFGNYKQQYDKFNDKMRWVSVAGDIAGLRADTNTKLNSWWASAGLDRGQIKNAQKIAFNPNGGQRDMLYKNKVNPVVSFPGQGNAIVWGQKTLQSKPSAFDRINVRGLFNTLERAISRMAKYYLFEFNDAFTRNRFVGTIKPFLEGVKAGRGCYDFYIRCDESNNTAAQIDANNFIADIAIKPTRVAEFITLNFIAVGTGVSFSEIFV